MHKSLNPVT